MNAPRIVTLALLLASYADPALAIRPELGLHFATEKQLICSNSYIFVAVISAARSPIQCAGIGVSGVYCKQGQVSPGFVDLSVKVTKVLERRCDHLPGRRHYHRR
jgi:hypothetical protein